MQGLAFLLNLIHCWLTIVMVIYMKKGLASTQFTHPGELSSEASFSRLRPSMAQIAFATFPMGHYVCFTELASSPLDLNLI